MSENEIKKPRIVKFLDEVEVKSFDSNQIKISQDSKYEALKDDNKIKDDNKENFKIAEGQNGNPIVLIKKGADVDREEINKALGDKRFKAEEKLVDDLPKEIKQESKLKIPPKLDLEKLIKDASKQIASLKKSGFSPEVNVNNESIKPLTAPKNNIQNSKGGGRE
ncbi:MAG: hypothetical protein ACO26G_05400 [Rickettsiales bacterium]